MDQVNQIVQANQIDERDEITLFDYWRLIRKRRKVVLYVFLIAVVGTAIISLLMTPIYQAKATLIAVDTSQTRFAAAFGMLQNLPFAGGEMGGMLEKTINNKLINILNSRTVAEDVINKLNLTKRIFEEDWDGEKGEWKTKEPRTMQDTSRILQKSIMKVTDDRKGLISISVEYKDPKLAASIADEYTAALQRFLNANAISLAKRNRILLGKQLEITKADLRNAEEKVKGYQTEKKLVAMGPQAQAAIQTLAELKGRIIAQEVELAALREFTTKANPDVKRMEDELREWRGQLRRLENGSKNPHPDESNGVLITLNEAPAVGLGYIRLRRDAVVQEKVLEFLTQQYEQAKIEEAKDDISFQVVDSAIAPEKRIKPKRTIMVGLAGVASLFLGILLVFFLEYLDKQKDRLKTVSMQETRSAQHSN